MRKITQRLIELSRKDPKPLANMMIKLGEEAGELAEAVNSHEGYLPHKTLKEPLIGEVSDVINCAISVMVKAYPAMTDEQLLEMLETYLVAKADKWELGINMMAEYGLHPVPDNRFKTAAAHIDTNDKGTGT
jgi:NTP pyrophosphatase (non-canonical NTP hydrolase)